MAILLIQLSKVAPLFPGCTFFCHRSLLDAKLRKLYKGRLGSPPDTQHSLSSSAMSTPVSPRISPKAAAPTEGDHRKR
jgi:hypothetical protein